MLSVHVMSHCLPAMYVLASSPPTHNSHTMPASFLLLLQPPILSSKMHAQNDNAPPAREKYYLLS